MRKEKEGEIEKRRRDKVKRGEKGRGIEERKHASLLVIGTGDKGKREKRADKEKRGE